MILYIFQELENLRFFLQKEREYCARIMFPSLILAKFITQKEKKKKGKRWSLAVKKKTTARV
jgi:hypothetical protein